MKKMKFIFLALSIMVSTEVSAQSEVTWKASTEHISADSYRVVFTAEIAAGWHMYDMGPYGDMGPNATRFTVEPSAGITLDGQVSPIDKPVRKYDELFGMEIGHYQRQARFVQKLRLSAASAKLKATVEWMVCDDKSCLAPTEEDFEIELTAVHNIGGNVVVPSQRVDIKQNVVPDAEPDVAEGVVNAVDAVDTIDAIDTVDTIDAETISVLETTTEQASGGDPLWRLILLAIGAGLLALLTPCIFPMVPMTVSFFMKGSKSPAHGRFRASMYGFFIVALYTVPIAVLMILTRIVGGENITTDIFNWFATHWIPNVLFFVVFMIFAASFFGAFEITLPSKLITKSDSRVDRGGVGGVFFMALTLVLISFSCTIPIVSYVLAESLAGEFWRPIITILAFSVTFALPFTLFAFLPMLLDKMPKSGGWLNSVKVVLGFIEVALGLKFLSVADQTYHWGILDREVYLAIWIVVFSLMGIYLLGKIKFKHDSEVKHLGIGRLTLVIVVFSFVAYLVPGMFGAPLKALSGYMPPMHTQDFVLGQGVKTGRVSMLQGDTLTNQQVPKYSDFLHLPHNLSGFFDLKQAQEHAARVGKPLFVDITGHGCVNCREMEARVWSDPTVLEILNNEYVIVAMYVDDRKTALESDWITTPSGKILKEIGKINAHLALKTFGHNAQPYYIIQDNNGKTLIPPRGYDLDIQAFIDFLRSGVEAYKAQ